MTERNFNTEDIMNESGQGTTASDTNSITILVVEDNDSNFILLKAILKKYHVERASNGLDAVNMTKENHYSVIFMDMKMPIMGGLEATRLIREFDKETPIVALTANAFDSDREDALLAGCNSYMSKPLKPSDIISLIEGL